tara:strand:+ start:1207 stop:1821 length:615 start_codon:yes stop_codon:yes gene_type:complete
MIIDLSHKISGKTVTYPSDPPIEILPEKQIVPDNSLVHSFKMGTHTGTHLDAPAHILKNGKTIDQIPLDQYQGLLIKVDLSSFPLIKEINIKYDGIILNCKWDQYFKNPQKFYSPDRPIIPLELINFLVKRKIKIFGCDLPSVDKSGDKIKPIHNALLKNNVIIYESLNNLSKLPNLKIFQFYGFPLPFEKFDGSPTRAVAFID